MKLLDKIVSAVGSAEEFVVATVVDTHGSAPGQIGFRMIVLAESSQGTVGGGALEKAVIDQARTLLRERQGARTIRYDLSELKMTCGGQTAVFYEPCYKKPCLWIFGAGHIARALTPTVSGLGFRVTVLDNREGFAVPEHFPTGTALLTGDYLAAIPALPRGAYAVIVTHGHAYDEQILNALAAIDPPLPYIGMIGSRRKVTLILDKMAAGGLNRQDNIYTPIGLRIGGDSAEEIALAIAAEILGIHHQTAGLPHCRLEPRR